MSERDVLAKANDKTADTEGSEKKDASSALVAEAHDAWSKTSENVDLTTVASVGASIIAGPLAGLATFAAARYGSDKQESKSLVDASKAPEALPQSIREKQTPEKISDSSEVTTHGTPGKENYSSQHTAGESQSQSRSELTAARIVKTAAEAASTTRSNKRKQAGFSC